MGLSITASFSEAAVNTDFSILYQIQANTSKGQIKHI